MSSDTPSLRNFVEWLRTQGAEEIQIGDLRIRFGPRPINGMSDQAPSEEDRVKALRDLYYASS